MSRSVELARVQMVFQPIKAFLKKWVSGFRLRSRYRLTEEALVIDDSTAIYSIELKRHYIVPFLKLVVIVKFKNGSVAGIEIRRERRYGGIDLYRQIRSELDQRINTYGSVLMRHFKLKPENIKYVQTFRS